MNTLNAQNASEAGTCYFSDLLAEVDFKWLMAGRGCWVDPVRLRSDQDYAHTCLTSALNSDCEPLRRCAVTLQDELEGRPPRGRQC